MKISTTTISVVGINLGLLILYAIVLAVTSPEASPHDLFTREMRIGLQVFLGAIVWGGVNLVAGGVLFLWKRSSLPVSLLQGFFLSAALLPLIGFSFCLGGAVLSQ